MPSGGGGGGERKEEKDVGFKPTSGGLVYGKSPFFLLKKGFRLSQRGRKGLRRRGGSYVVGGELGRRSVPNKNRWNYP